MSRKIGYVILILAIVISSTLTVYAYENPSKVTETIVKRPGIQKSSYDTTIEDIDEMVLERTRAILNSDLKTANKINEKLHNSGMQYITAAEFTQMTGETLSNRLYAEFETVYSTLDDGENVYDIMRIYAVPNIGSNLYQSGNTSKRNTNSARVDALAALGAKAVSAAGVQTVAVLETLYSLFEDIIVGLTATQTVMDVEAAYVWSTAEICIFLYAKPEGSSEWTMVARFSQVDNTVTTVINTLTTTNINATTGSDVVEKNTLFKPVRFNNTMDAVRYGSENDVYEAVIDSVEITGIENKLVKRAYMRKPRSIGEVT